MAPDSIKGIVKDVIIVAACLAVIWIGLTAYFGAQNPFYVVSSGSMYPELAMYDIIVISGHTLFEDVKIGDIIVFDRPKDHDKVIVHRVVAVVDDDPKTLRTKGDNNQNSIVGTDYPITKEEYTGTVVYVIPQIGFITKILQPPINYIIIAVIIGIMIIRQISKNKKKASAESEDDAIEAVTDDWVPSKSSIIESERTGKPASDGFYYRDATDDIKNSLEEIKAKEAEKEEKKSEDIPEFFHDKEKESKEKK